VALTDILDKLGGQKGQQGGVAAIAALFGGKGLPGIISALQSSGLDKQVKSWIGNGQNMPVSGADIKRAADSQMLMRMAKQQGMSPDELADHIAQVLPQVVDSATPAGQVPKQGGVDAMTRTMKKK
jgi:uncharacterized protein YidB (DUF937 family)